MAYVRPTSAQFKIRYPAFATVTDELIDLVMLDAPVDESWLESDYQKAIMLYAAHVLTTEGQGTGAAAEVVAEYGQGVTKLKAGDTEIQFAGAAAAGSSGAGTTFGATIYGQQFAELCQLNQGGPIVAGSVAAPASPYARDWSGWPFVTPGR